MELSIKIKIPYLWGVQEFCKDKWGATNFLVGPNGTGKTLFAEVLRVKCDEQGLKTRYLNAERLSGLERRHYGRFGSSNLDRGFDVGDFEYYKTQGRKWGLSADAFVILKEKLDVRLKIETCISSLFGRRIRLAEEGGYLNPKMQRIVGGDEYGLKESECHGLKELISLLTFLYEDEYNCLIIDEPELHLHPQFQTFFIQEIRKLAGDPTTETNKKCFFLITHSPYIVDVRTLNDLRNCVVFQPNKLPTFIEEFDSDDEYRLRCFLPRLNTHHKQFFFASRPIFVEGYTDQQLLSLIQETRGILLGASGACIIDVGGKDELDCFFRLCRKLNIEAQFIGDMDIIFNGKLRQSVASDGRCKNYLQEQGVNHDAMGLFGDMAKELDNCIEELEKALSSDNNATELKQLYETLVKTTYLNKKRYIFLVGIRLQQMEIQKVIPQKESSLTLIQGQISQAKEAFEQCGVYILSNGELENYLPSYEGNPYNVPDEAKQRVFQAECDFVLSTNNTIEQDFNSRYGELITILDKACGALPLETESYLSETVGDWIHRVQRTVNRGDVKDEDSLKTDAAIGWGSYSRIFELQEFTPKSDGFSCAVRLKELVDSKRRIIRFDDKTHAASYVLPSAS